MKDKKSILIIIYAIAMMHHRVMIEWKVNGKGVICREK